MSFAHGSNDGQKGVGLVMLILIGLLPADFALNTSANGTRIAEAVAAVERVEQKLSDPTVAADVFSPSERASLQAELQSVRASLHGKSTVRDIPREVRWEVRSRIQRVDDELGRMKAAGLDLEAERRSLKDLTEYAPPWVILAVALSLGVGTMVGWRRIVVTIGEKIGKTHMSYSQGAAGELVAASTIGVSASLGLPVSTTHVLSSGIAGTMLAQKVGLQRATIRNIALAWLLTFPVSMVLAGALLRLCGASSRRRRSAVARRRPWRRLAEIAPASPSVARIEPGARGR